MSSATCRRLAPASRRLRASSAVAGRFSQVPGARLCSDQSERAEQPHTFHPASSQFSVCPLSKKPLRYEASTNELVNEELGIAYPIIDGIPNMIPQAARTTRQNEKQEEAEQP